MGIWSALLHEKDIANNAERIAALEHRVQTMQIQLEAVSQALQSLQQRMNRLAGATEVEPAQQNQNW
jgi:predicted  nucleic acid-binding Zn-ribbon protein